MSIKPENYKKIKGILLSAKQTFLNEDGREIVPTLENLTKFNEELTKIKKLVDELYVKIHSESKD